VSVILPERAADSSWKPGDAELLLSAAQRADAVAFGPGLGRGPCEREITRALLSMQDRPPMVIDADALFALSQMHGALELLKPSDVITPHPGEAAALLSTTAQAVQADRISSLRELTKRTPAVCVLKGEGTLIGRRDASPVISPWKIPQLAVAGSGDVMAGITAALLARFPHDDSSLNAAAIAVWIHAMAGASLARDFPMRGNGPHEIADAVPHVLASAGALHREI
ncbi:MAG: NAD(P)H-hydrate dehydratase, partial [Mailhella sp.]|nr:NAD(P)H-hydrate dehydratase [Mailhella sp.]